MMPGVKRRRAVNSATSAGTALSKSKGGYFPPQALYPQSTSAGGSDEGADKGPDKNIGP